MKPRCGCPRTSRPLKDDKWLFDDTNTSRNPLFHLLLQIHHQGGLSTSDSHVFVLRDHTYWENEIRPSLKCLLTLRKHLPGPVRSRLPRQQAAEAPYTFPPLRLLTISFLRIFQPNRFSNYSGLDTFIIYAHPNPKELGWELLAHET